VTVSRRPYIRSNQRHHREHEGSPTLSVQSQPPRWRVTRGQPPATARAAHTHTTASVVTSAGPTPYRKLLHA
jgi:hypothetical protein